MQRRNDNIISRIVEALASKYLVESSQHITLKGRVELDILRAGGAREFLEFDNVITDMGENEAAKLLCGVTADHFSHIAIGTSDAAATDANVALAAEITTYGGARAHDAAPTTNANVATVVVTFNFTVPTSFAVKEVGLLNAASNGDILCRQIFDVVNVGNGDSMTVTWNITAGVAR